MPPPRLHTIKYAFAVGVLACPKCPGRMRLLAMVEDPANVARFLTVVGEATELPEPVGLSPRAASAPPSPAASDELWKVQGRF